MFSGGIKREHWGRNGFICSSNKFYFQTSKRGTRSIRSTMTGSRLNHLLMIHIYKEEFDEMGMKLMMNKFIKKKKSRTAIFALFQL